ncbi:MAG: RNA polymerase factor sigma-54 [Phycisphaerales bacterium]|nr:RNA polymerase factor sigma-54 [Phycisphaerales bacterium]
MRFETAQHMKLAQQMKLAPRMIQSMEILQMPLLALEERIEQELESNVTLETFQPTADREAIEEQRAQVERDARENERELNVDGSGSADDFERLDNLESSYSEAFDNAYEGRSYKQSEEYEPTYSPRRMAGERDAKMDAMANTEARPRSLHDQLLEQWMFADVDDDTREAGKLLIERIDDDGYMRIDLAEIAAQSRFDIEALKAALEALQHGLEPPGMAARDVRECLLLQIDALAHDAALTAKTNGHPAADWAIVRLLVEEHLDDLIHNRIPRIAQRTELTVDQVKQAMEHMHRLMLHPGRALVNETPPTIIPDAIVEYDDDLDDYMAYLTDARLPNLRINREYALMARDRSLAKQDREFIRTNLGNAQWLIDAVNQRQNTLLRVVKAVVAAQRDYLDQGQQALKPLPMSQVADQLGMHVATVSRAVAGKYLQTPRGVVALRKLFTGGTQTDSGEDVSWETIKAALQEVVAGEDKAKPLSDEALVAELKKRGIEIARRTIAKYRGQLDIPPARLRKEF